jgi:hypothetical protein
LLLQREPARWWTAQEAAGALRPGASLSEADVARYFGTGALCALVGSDPAPAARSSSETYGETYAQMYKRSVASLPAQ